MTPCGWLLLLCVVLLCCSPVVVLSQPPSSHHCYFPPYLENGSCYGSDQYNDDTQIAVPYCQVGFYGQSCNITCPINCTQIGCTNMGYCIGYVGTDIKDRVRYCKSGYYGSTCQFQCPSHCQYGCTGDGSCYLWDYFGIDNDDHEARYCNELSYYGQYCNQTCPIHCTLKGCSNVGSCIGHPFSNTPLTNIASHCLSGWYGNTCTNPCPINCAQSYCAQDGSCYNWYNYQNQQVAQQCKIGYWGQYCNRTCTQHCTVCTNLGDCLVCQQGYYGPTTQNHSAPASARRLHKSPTPTRPLMSKRQRPSDSPHQS